MEKKLHYNNEILHTILIVDDEEINREILGAMLEDKYKLLYAADGNQALDQLKKHKKQISLVLLDLIMPGMDGFQVIQAVKEDDSLSRIPIIVLTAEKDAEVKSIDLGAVDFIPKPYDMPEIILSRINRMIELYEDQCIIQSTERDELTGLFSKNFFYEYSSMMESYHPERPMDAVVLNIDHFHLLNEIYGQEFGDQVLKQLSRVIKAFANKHEGIAGRGEGDNFFMYLNHQKNYNYLFRLFKEEVLDRFKSSQIHIRTGICCKTDDTLDIKTMFSRAKTACNTIKGKYNQTLAYFDENLQRRKLFQEQLILDINTAIEEKQFLLYYQPKYAIQGDRPVMMGCEALVRWKHPKFGMISPNQFISLFEANGLIQLVDRYVWEEAMSQSRDWQEEFGTVIPISVNVSRIDFYDSHLSEHILDLIKKYKVKPRDLHLEITESAYADNPTHIAEVVTHLQSKGFIIELDDFGSGYSSLGVLSSIPIDTLKIDMKFIATMFDDSKNRKMVEIIMDIAKMLEVPVIAEGVEKEEQYKALKEMGCDMIQGFYFSKPLTAQEFTDFLRSQAKPQQ